MALYSIKMVKDGRVRELPSIYGNPHEMLETGFTFESSELVDFTDTVGGQLKYGKWAKLPGTGYWTAVIYDGVTFAQYTDITPVPTGEDIFIKILVDGVAVLDDVYPSGTKVSIEVS